MVLERSEAERGRESSGNFLAGEIDRGSVRQVSAPPYFPLPLYFSKIAQKLIFFSPLL